MKLNLHSPLMEFINLTVQFIMLNLVFLICCIPIITIGPAITALYRVILREERGEGGYLFSKFFQHFKETFLTSFCFFFAGVFIILLLLFNLFFWNAFGGILSSIILVIICLLLLCVICSFLYIFPILARFQNSFIQTVKNSFFIAFTNIKRTFILLLINLGVTALVFIYHPFVIFMLFVGFTFITYCNSYIINPIFQKLIEAETESSTK